jgi:sodium-coupled neutral amino acid transporter 9
MNTIFALVNSMIGGTMLTLPLLFRDSGIITSWIILVISGYISRKTCDIYIKHLAHDEDDIQDSIKRILKGKWYEFFCLITGIYLIMLNVLYIVLINDQLYNLVGYLAYKGAHGPSTKLASKA